jgi:hypothetical protein
VKQLVSEWQSSVESQPVKRRLGGWCEMAASLGPSSVDSWQDFCTELERGNRGIVIVNIRYQATVPENSYHQPSGRHSLFKPFRFVWWMCAHPLLWLLFGFSIHKWKPRFITWSSCDVIEKFIAIFVVSLYKSHKAKAILWVLCAPVSIYGTDLAQNLW